MKSDAGGGAWSPLAPARIVADLALHDATALALIAPGRPPLSFGALLWEVRRAVNSIALAGFGQGDRIAVALPNRPESVVALLAATDCAT